MKSAPDPLVLVNGSPVGYLSPLDRGLAYGDGVFRTLRLEAGEPIWWNDHHAKLEADCRQLGIASPSRAEWEQDIAWIAVRQPDAVLRLTVTRGAGPRGYRMPEVPIPVRIVTAAPPPLGAEVIAEHGATLRLCELRLGHQPRLAGVKHLNRLENVLARAEWDDPAIHEGVLLDTDGHLVSGVMSNLFLWHDGHLGTPLLDRCGVAGVTRERLLRAAHRLGIAVDEGRFQVQHLLDAEAVLLTNSLIGVWPVARLGGRHWDPSPIAERLREALCSDD